MEEYKLAVKRADELVVQMGDGWEPEVWENLGWHSRIVRSHCTIHIHQDTYWIDLQLPGLGQLHRTIRTEDSPVEGYAELIHIAKAKLDEAEKALLDL